MHILLDGYKNNRLRSETGSVAGFSTELSLNTLPFLRSCYDEKQKKRVLGWIKVTVPCCAVKKSKAS